MRRAFWRTAVGAFAVLAAPRLARASAPVDLDWSAPAGCPASADVLDDVNRTVGPGASSGRVHARVVVTREGDAFRARVELGGTGPDATRTFEADSCRTIAKAVAIVVALAVNPDSASPAAGEIGAADTAMPLTPAAAAPTPPATQGQGPSPPAASPVSAFPTGRAGAVSETLPSATPRRSPFLAAASLVVDTSLLPQVGYGAELAAAWSPARFDLEIVASVFAPQDAHLASQPSQGARLLLGHVGARACYEAFAGRIVLSPCGGVGLEWMMAHGFGPPPDVPTDATGEMVVGTAGARLQIRVSSRLVVRWLGEAVLPFAHPTFFIDRGGGQVFRTPTGSFRTALGAEAHF